MLVGNRDCDAVDVFRGGRFVCELPRQRLEAMTGDALERLCQGARRRNSLASREDTGNLTSLACPRIGL